MLTIALVLKKVDVVLMIFLVGSSVADFFTVKAIKFNNLETS